jgi:dolichol-phosphate mannosyltransferase
MMHESSDSSELTLAKPVWLTGIAVVIPCYKVTRHIEAVLHGIGPEVDHIYCIDDACPDSSGDFISREISNARVVVLRHVENLGVGGAVMTGYRRAIQDGAKVIVKIDGDGQMDPKLLMRFVGPILKGDADYTKGNRFWDMRQITRMPMVRRFGSLSICVVYGAPILA